ncbi:zinc finger protein 184-like [Topomyia yanbarensis]|uniref:zinc finger protein 184-like n=1 Tax=Topomyia yanbarensis TaxID=2498891 RepID=UPI00273CA7B3|nr:zinc finger protein 184-like [Topomyia yanbarensis]
MLWNLRQHRIVNENFAFESSSRLPEKKLMKNDSYRSISPEEGQDYHQPLRKFCPDTFHYLMLTGGYTRKRLKCSDCDQLFVSTVSLKQHYSQYHETSSASFSVDRIFCLPCSLSFAEKSYYERHRWVYHEDTTILQLKASSEGFKELLKWQKVGSRTLFACPICLKIIRNRKRHMRIRHGMVYDAWKHRFFVRYKCSRCRILLKQRRKMLIHLQVCGGFDENMNEIGNSGESGGTENCIKEDDPTIGSGDTLQLKDIDIEKANDNLLQEVKIKQEPELVIEDSESMEIASSIDDNHENDVIEIIDDSDEFIDVTEQAQVVQKPIEYDGGPDNIIEDTDQLGLDIDDGIVLEFIEESKAPEKEIPPIVNSLLEKAVFTIYDSTDDAVEEESQTNESEKVIPTDSETVDSQRSTPTTEYNDDPSSETDSDMYLQINNSFYKCKYCPLTFRHASLIQRHVKIRHPTKWRNFGCSHCNRKFPSTINRDRHEHFHSLKHPFKCTDCDQMFNRKHPLEQHTQLFHRINSKSFTLRRLKCLYCSRSFVERKYYNQHLKVYHQYRSERIQALTEKVQLCERCVITFKTKKSLQQHIKQVHSSDRALHNFECPRCDKDLKIRSTLRLHLLTVHLGHLPFKCQRCEAGFPTRYAFMKHYRSVHVRTFPCDDCGNQFKSKSKRDRHQEKCQQVDPGRYPSSTRMVIRERSSDEVDDFQVQCGHCSLQLSDVTLLRKHCEDEHPMEPVALQCPRCGKIYRNAFCYKLHYDQHAIRDDGKDDGKTKDGRQGNEWMRTATKNLKSYVGVNAVILSDVSTAEGSEDE